MHTPPWCCLGQRLSRVTINTAHRLHNSPYVFNFNLTNPFRDPSPLNLHLSYVLSPSLVLLGELKRVGWSLLTIPRSLNQFGLLLHKTDTFIMVSFSKSKNAQRIFSKMCLYCSLNQGQCYLITPSPTYKPGTAHDTPPSEHKNYPQTLQRILIWPLMQSLHLPRVRVEI